MDFRKVIIFFQLTFVVLLIASCSRPPCEKYLSKNWPVVKPEKLIKIPKPIPDINRRAYDLCLLRTHRVQVIRLGQTWKFVLLNDELFDNDTAAINDRYKPVLNIIADFMQTYSKISVKVASYSDHALDEVMTKFGSLTDQLTERQAATVAHYLQKHCANARLIYAVGRGDRDPIAWDDSAAGRRLNRRVEVSFKYYRDSKAWY